MRAKLTSCSHSFSFGPERMWSRERWQSAHDSPVQASIDLPNGRENENLLFAIVARVVIKVSILFPEELQEKVDNTAI